MKFDKKEKKWLKKHKLWGKVKKNTKQHTLYRRNERYYLGNAFDWIYTSEGLDFWEDIWNKMRGKMK